MLNSLCGQSCCPTTRVAILAILPDFKFRLPHFFRDCRSADEGSSSLSSLDVDSSATAADAEEARPILLRRFSMAWDKSSNSRRSQEETSLCLFFLGTALLPVLPEPASQLSLHCSAKVSFCSSFSFFFREISFVFCQASFNLVFSWTIKASRSSAVASGNS